jgi:uncharacterized membrane protein YfcA
MDTLVLIVVGAVAGTLSGLLGIGGGAIIVPVLALLFEHQGMSDGVLMQAAIGTSLATIFFTSVSSVRAHHARRSIRWPVFWQLTPGIVVGTLIGAAVAHWLPGNVLKILFGAFLLLIAAQMARGQTLNSHRPLPRPRSMALAGGVIGALSALFGIGGGSLSVPFLTWCSLKPVEAIATSAAMGVPIALGGTIGYVVTGLYASGLPPWSVGYVVLPPFAGVVVASVLFAPLGARLAHRLPQLTLQRVFAALLVVLGLRLLFD